MTPRPRWRCNLHMVHGRWAQSQRQWDKPPTWPTVSIAWSTFGADVGACTPQGQLQKNWSGKAPLTWQVRLGVMAAMGTVAPRHTTCENWCPPWLTQKRSAGAECPWASGQLPRTRRGSTNGIKQGNLYNYISFHSQLKLLFFEWSPPWHVRTCQDEYLDISWIYSDNLSDIYSGSLSAT